MTVAFQQAEQYMTQLSDQEARVLMAHYFDRKPKNVRGITKTPGVCGGRACIEGTRMPVWSLVYHRFLGFADWEILDNFPTMQPADLKNAWRFYEANKVEIDEDIRENTEDDGLEND